MLFISRKADDDLVATTQLITRPNLQDEVSFLRLPELKSVTSLSFPSRWLIVPQTVPQQYLWLSSYQLALPRR
jgi:hypothetical protein